MLVRHAADTNDQRRQTMTTFGYVLLTLLGVGAVILLYRAARDYDTEHSDQHLRRPPSSV